MYMPWGLREGKSWHVDDDQDRCTMEWLGEVEKTEVELTGLGGEKVETRAPNDRNRTENYEDRGRAWSIKTQTIGGCAASSSGN